MVLEENITLAPEVVPEIVSLLNSLGKWILAANIAILIIIVSNIINIILNRKKLKIIIALKEEIDRLENRLNRVLRRRQSAY